MRISIMLRVTAAVAAMLSLGACDWMQKKAPPNEKRVAAIEKSRSKFAHNACASSRAYERLMKLAFDEAIQIRNADPVNLATLAAHTVVRMEGPLVKSSDDVLNVTVCSGRFILELPPGAERGFAGEHRLVADIEYAAQPAADGSGLVYRLRGAEPIIYKLAAFDLRAEPKRSGSADDATRFAWVPDDSARAAAVAAFVPVPANGLPPAAWQERQQSAQPLPRQVAAAFPPLLVRPDWPSAAPPQPHLNRAAAASNPAVTAPPRVAVPRPAIPSRAAQAGNYPGAWNSLVQRAKAALNWSSSRLQLSESEPVATPVYGAQLAAEAGPPVKAAPIPKPAQKVEPPTKARIEHAQVGPKVAPAKAAKAAMKAKPSNVGHVRSVPKPTEATVRLAKAEPKRKAPQAKQATASSKPKAAPVRLAKAETKRKAPQVREAKASLKPKAASARTAKAEPKRKTSNIREAKASSKAKAAPVRQAKAEPKRKAPKVREAKAASKVKASAVKQAKAEPKKASRTKAAAVRLAKAELKKAKAVKQSKNAKAKSAAVRQAKAEPKKPSRVQQAKVAPKPKPKAAVVRQARLEAKRKSARVQLAAAAPKVKSSRMKEVEAAINSSGQPTKLAAAASPKPKVAALRQLAPEPKAKPAPVRAAAAVAPNRSQSASGCGAARSRGAQIACSDQRLAALHRTTRSLDSRAMNEADRRTRAELARTRSAFLAWRDRCSSATCVADAYQGRLEEIRDLMRR